MALQFCSQASQEGLRSSDGPFNHVEVTIRMSLDIQT